MKIEKLFPECKDYLWGGEKLKEKYGKITEKSPCAESWELSFHKDGPSRLSDGRTLGETATKEDIGTAAEKFPFFPTLIKFIDAKGDLSIQVHPSDDYALKHENSFGKTEMWYIVEADEGAGIYLGFNKDVTKEEFARAIEKNSLTDLLNFYEVRKGECYFIPSGTLHAICKGCLICEIQQNSNLTYRVYDYGRKDKNGKERELHVEKALAVTNLNKMVYKPIIASNSQVIGSSEYFETTFWDVSGENTFRTDGSSFACVTAIDGEGEIDGERIKAGDSFFVPANYGEYTVKGKIKILKTEI